MQTAFTDPFLKSGRFVCQDDVLAMLQGLFFQAPKSSSSWPWRYWENTDYSAAHLLDQGKEAGLLGVLDASVEPCKPRTGMHAHREFVRHPTSDSDSAIGLARR